MLAEIVVVTYHSRLQAASEMEAFIELARARPDVGWVFVDNSEDSGDAAWLAELVIDVPQIRVIHRPDNPGFAGGCNVAAATSRAEWIVLLNPDITLDGTGLDMLVTALSESRPGVSALALSQVTDGLVHAGIGFNAFGWLMDLPVQGQGKGSRTWMFRLAGGGARLVGPSGGAGAYRRVVFSELGGFYDPLFAWGEDADLALRLALTDGACERLDLRLPHQGGHSVATREVIRRRARLLVRNRVIIAARLYSTPQVMLFGVFLIAVTLAKLPLMVADRTLSEYFRGLAKGISHFRKARSEVIGPRLTVRRRELRKG